MGRVFLDFETYYAKGYTLSSTKLSMSEYVRHPDFKAHMVQWAVDDGPILWCPTDEIAANLATIDWDDTELVCHNTAFDGFILNQHYGITPARYADTMLMSRALYGANVKHGLEDVGNRLGLGGKHDAEALLDTKGIRDLDEEQLQRMANYGVRDVELLRLIYNELAQRVPEEELDLIDLTLLLFCKPVLELDMPRIEDALAAEVGKKVAALMKAGVTADQLTSNDAFARLLEARAVQVPMKVSPTTGRTTYAFSKKDVDFLALKDHPDADIRRIVEARLAVKSTIGETRATRFLEAGRDGGKLPVLLQYCGAHTTRWCMKGSTEVLTPQGWVRLDAMQNGTSIAQWSPDGALRWGPADVASFPFDGDLLGHRGDYIDAQYTGEHRIPAFTTGNAFKVHTAEAAYGKNLRLPTQGVLDAGSEEMPDDLLRLYVATQAGGCIEDADRRPLRFGFSKTRKIARFRELCTRLGIPWSKYPTKPRDGRVPHFKFSIARKNVPPVLWGAKSFGTWLLHLSLRQRRVFLEELRYWDGTVSNRNVVYHTAHRGNAELVATLAHISGYSATVCVDSREAPHADKYTVTIRDNAKGYAHVRAETWFREAYQGQVYCPITETGFFLARSAGKIFVTGNSAGNKMNMQNLPAKGELRRSILAPPGHVLVVVDSAQIEARTNLWLANDQEKLQIFRDYDAGVGPDLYKVTASKVFNVPLEAVTPDQRALGKVLALALGYGMGAPKLQDTLATDKFNPVHMTLNDCYDMVQGWRRLNAPVVASWANMEKLANFMLFDSGSLEYRGLAFRKEEMVLPSGLAIHYDGLRGVWDDYTQSYRDMTFKGRNGVVKLYGGLLTENAVQGMARCIVATQMLQIARRYRVVMMTHDEVVYVAREEEAEEAFQFGLEAFRAPPSWAPDLPVKAAGGFARNYSK